MLDIIKFLFKENVIWLKIETEDDVDFLWNHFNPRFRELSRTGMKNFILRSDLYITNVKYSFNLEFAILDNNYTGAIDTQAKRGNEYINDNNITVIPISKLKKL